MKTEISLKIGDDIFECYGVGYYTGELNKNVSITEYPYNKYPYNTNGSCFCLLEKDLEASWGVLNMNLENFYKLLNDNVIEYPVDVLKIDEGNNLGDKQSWIGCSSKGCIVIVDKRIPKKWFRGERCGVCCPPSLIEKVDEYFYKGKN